MDTTLAPQATPDTAYATSTEATTTVVGWEGPLAPLDTVTGADRRMLRYTSAQVHTRQLPLPMKFQEVSAPAHDNAISGLAMITRVWQQNGYIWGSGPFNLSDPRAVKLANDVLHGFAGWVSVEIDADTYTAEKHDGQTVKVFRDFTISGATMVGDPAFDRVRVFAVTDPDRITPAADVMAATRAQHGLNDYGRSPQRGESFVLAFSGSPRRTFADGDKLTGPSVEYLQLLNVSHRAVLDLATAYLALPDGQRNDAVTDMAQDIVDDQTEQADDAETLLSDTGNPVEVPPEVLAKLTDAIATAAAPEPETEPADEPAPSDTAMSRQWFAVVGDTSLPFADRDHSWDAAAATSRVFDMADGDTDTISRAYLYRDDDADPTTKTAYSLPFADVINGRLTAVFAGVAAAAGRLNQTSLPDDDLSAVKGKLRSLYSKAAKDFGDDSIVAPDYIQDSNGEETAMANGDAPAQQAPNGEQPNRDQSNGDVDQATVDAVVEAVRPIVEQLVADAVAAAIEQPAREQEMAQQMSRLHGYV